MIQICADLSNPATATRECRALAAAGKDGDGNYVATFAGASPGITAWGVTPVGKVVSITVLSCFPRARRQLVTLTQDGLPTKPPAGVEMHSTCEWLLQSAR